MHSVPGLFQRGKIDDLREDPVFSQRISASVFRVFFASFFSGARAKRVSLARAYFGACFASGAARRGAIAQFRANLIVKVTSFNRLQMRLDVLEIV